MRKQHIKLNFVYFVCYFLSFSIMDGFRILFREVSINYSNKFSFNSRNKSYIAHQVLAYLFFSYKYQYSFIYNNKSFGDQSHLSLYFPVQKLLKSLGSRNEQQPKPWNYLIALCSCYSKNN